MWTSILKSPRLNSYTYKIIRKTAPGNTYLQSFVTTTFNISVIYVTDQKKIQRRNTPVNQQQMVRKIKASVWRVRGPGFWSSSVKALRKNSMILNDYYYLTDTKLKLRREPYSVKLSNKILIWIYKRNLFLEKHILNIIQTIKNKSIVMWYLG